MSDQGRSHSGEPPVLSHVQCTLSVRMAAHLNQNNGALRHSWWDILIYVIPAYPSTASLFSDEEAHGPACWCPLTLQVRWSRHATLFVSLSTVTLNHRSQALATDGAEEVHLCSKQGLQFKINFANILNHFFFLKWPSKTCARVRL